MPIILGALVVFFVFICLRLFLNAKPETLILLLKSALGAMAIVGIVVLILSGRFINAALGLVALIALLPLSKNFVRSLKNTKGSQRRDRKTLSSMTLSQACDILNISPQATIEEINAAHHRLIKQVHPDHGGSDYLAAQVNLAKDFLIQQRQKL